MSVNQFRHADRLRFTHLLILLMYININLKTLVFMCVLYIASIIFIIYYFIIFILMQPIGIVD